MRKAFGRNIPESLDDLLQFKAAVLVWDMQRSIADRASNRDELVSGVRRILDAARATETPVIYSQHYSLPFESEDVAWIHTWWRRSRAESPDTLTPLALPGTPAWEFLDEVAPTIQDTVIPKTRPSLFVGTPARDILASHGVQTLIICGVSTDRGVLTTAQHAILVGLLPIVVSDATGSYTDALHEGGLAAASDVAEIATSTEIADRLLARAAR